MSPFEPTRGSKVHTVRTPEDIPDPARSSCVRERCIVRYMEIMVGRTATVIRTERIRPSAPRDAEAMQCYSNCNPYHPRSHFCLKPIKASTIALNRVALIARLARSWQALQSDKSVQCVRNPAPIENRVAAVQQCIVSRRGPQSMVRTRCSTQYF